MEPQRTDDERWDRDVQQLLVHGRDREAAEAAVRHLREEPLAERMAPLDQLDQLGGVLTGVAAGIRLDQLDAATPCVGFCVRDVLGHMIEGATYFAAALQGQEPPAPPADAAAGPDVVARAGAALGELMGAAHSPGALDRTIASPFGDITGEDLARYLVVDGLVHGWDITTATGAAYDPPAELVAEADAFARSFIGPDLRDGDAFAAATEPPAGATPIERLAAFTGRDLTSNTNTPSEQKGTR